MTYLIAGSLCIWSFIKRNSKVVFYLLIIFMFIMFAWSFQTADWNIYLNRYNNYMNTSSDTEPLFLLLNKSFYSSGLDFRIFLIFLSAIIVFGYGKIIMDNTMHYNFVLAMYFIFPFIMEVSQIRFALGAFFAIWGMTIILKEECSKKDYLYSIGLIIVASLIHYALISAFVFLIAKFMSRKIIVILVIISIVISIFVIVTVNSDFMLQGKSVLPYKVNLVLKLQKARSMNLILKIIFRMLVYFAFNFVIYYILLKNFSKNSLEWKKADLVWKWNIISLTYIPLIIFASDFYRIQQILTIINYIIYTSFFGDNCGNGNKINKKNMLFSCLCIIFAIINLYFLVLDNPNINTVFYPFFNNNIVFNKIL